MKNRKLGKILVVALFVLLFAALLAVSVSAAEPVTVDVTNEAGLKAALADETVDTINIAGDVVNITSAITINRSVTINGSGTVLGKVGNVDQRFETFVLTADAAGNPIDVTFGGSVVYADVSLVLKGACTLTLTDNVKIACGQEADAIVDYTNSAATSIVVNDQALVEGRYAIFYAQGGSDKTLTVNNGTINAKHAVAVSFTADVTVNMNGGLVNVTDNLLFADDESAALTLNLAGGKLDTDSVWNDVGTLSTTKTGGELTSNEIVLITAENKATFFDDIPSAAAAAVDNDVIEVWGTHTLTGFTLNATVTFTANGVVNGAATITVADGKNVTFADQGVWNNCQISLAGNNTVTFTDDVKLAHASAHLIVDESTTDTTIKVEKNAELSAVNNYLVYYLNNATDVTTKKLEVTGGKLTANYLIVMGDGQSKMGYMKPDFTISGGELTATKNIFHIGTTPHIIEDGTMDNAASITISNAKISAGQYIFMIYNALDANITVNSGELICTTDEDEGSEIAINISSTSRVHIDLLGGTYNISKWVADTIPADLSIKIVADLKATVVPTTVMPNGVHIDQADGSVICYSNLALALEYDIDGDILVVHGTVPMGGNVTIDKKITINGTGTVNGGSKVISVSAEEVTFGGSVTWNNIQVTPTGDNVTVNFTDDVRVETTMILVNDTSATGNFTLNISKNAYLKSAGNILELKDTEAAETAGTKNINMDGGCVEGNYVFVVYASVAGTDVNFNLTNGEIKAVNNALHIDRTQLVEVSMTNMTITASGASFGHVVAAYGNAGGSNVTVTVNGGTYTSENMTVFHSGTASTMAVDLQAGSFNGNPVFNFANAGTLVATVNNACVLTPAAEIANGARIVHTDGYTYYQTLAPAVEAAKAGETIELFGTNTVPATFVIDKDLTFIGGEGTTVTASGISLFTVQSGAKLTLGGYTAWTTDTTCITVGEGGAHIVFTDAVQFTNTKNDDGSSGAIVLDKNADTNTTIEVLKNKEIDGQPVLTCYGWGFDFETPATGNDRFNIQFSGIKTVNMDCGSLTASYAIVFNIGGVTADITIANATFSASHDVIYFNNKYFASENDGNVGTIALTNVTVLDCDNVFDTQHDCRANITVNGGSFTSEHHVFCIDKSASVINLTLNGGAYTTTGADKFVILFNTTTEDSLLTITGEASFKGSWFLVSDGLIRTSIAWDTITVETTNAAGGIFASARVKNADGTWTYGSIKNVVAYAPADSTIDIDGVPTDVNNVNNVVIDKNLTFTGIGTVTAVNGASLFTVKNGATVTFSGSTHWRSNHHLIVIGEGGAHIVITDTVQFTNTYATQSDKEHGAIVYDELGNVNTTVEVLKSDKGAPTLTSIGWTIDFEGDDDTAFTGIKTVNINGATVSGSHPVVFNVSGVTGNVSIKNATLTAIYDGIFINNKYFETDDEEARNGNVFNLYIESTSIETGNNIILVQPNATVDVTIHSGTFTANNQDIVDIGSGSDAKIVIQNGTFTSAQNIILVNENTTTTTTIHNGTFTSNGGAHALLQTAKSAGITANLNMYGGTLVRAQYGIVFWNDSTGNVVLEERNGNEISFTTNSNMMYAGNTAEVSFSFTGGTYVAGSSFAVAASSSKVNYTLSGGMYTAKGSFFSLESSSETTAHLTNVNAKSGYNTDTNSYVTSYGYGIVFGSSAKANFTIDGADTVIQSPLRVFAIHDYSNVTLNIDGGLYQNTTTDATAENRFVIYQSSANNTASTLNLTAKNAQFINHAGNTKSAAFRINDAGSTNTSSFTNCVLRGVHVIQQNSGVMDLTLEKTQLQITGGGANRTDTGHGILIAGSSGKNKIHLKSGTTIKAFEDTAELVLNPNKVGNGIALRWISVDFTMEKGAVIDVKGVGLGSVSYKNDSNETKHPRVSDSTFVINGGTITSEGVAIAFWANSTDATKPSSLTINGGSFTSNTHALWVYTDNGGCTATVNDGTFISLVSGHACNTYSNSGDITLNINGGLFEAKGETAGDFTCQVKANGDNVNVVANIHGGTFVANKGDAALYVLTKYSAPTEGCTATANVYGGYFEGHALCAARSSSGGVLNVWGGTFRYENENAGHHGAPIRSGTGSNVGTVHIWGGNFYTTATAASGLFTCMNDKSTLTVHGGFNGVGGRVVFEDYNATVNGGTVVHKIGTQVANNSIYMQEGAAVRLASGSNGLRFKGYVTAEVMAYINSIADAGSVTFGTIIAPEDYLAGAYAFTAEELDRLGLKYLDLKADYGLTANEDGSYTISAAITNIKEDNYKRNFAATCYVEYTVNGNTVRVYSNFRALKNVRSMAQIARIALTDTSRYTDAQREVLAIYAPTEAAPVLDIYLVAGQSNAAGCTNFTADFAASDENFTSGYSNILYHGVSVGGTAFAAKRIYENVPVKAGYGCGTGEIGPELGMAKALSQVYNQETKKMAAIVKYAYGGTGLADTISGQNFPEGSWCPPSWLEEHGKVDEYKSGGLYRAFVAQIQSAISDFRALGYEINIVGGYWMQGCNDRHNDPDVYADMFECWLSDLREDVYAITRDEADLKMPMLVGEISDYFGQKYKEEADSYTKHYTNCTTFTQMQREQIGALENVHIIPNGTLPTWDHQGDNAHWDSHSALWIGQRVGMTFMSQYLNTEYVVSDEDLVATVTLGGEVIGRYDSLVGALNEAPDGSTVELMKDLTLYSTLVIGNRNEITLNGNDHTIDFVLGTSNGDTSMIMWYATDMTVNDLHISQNNYGWGTQLRMGAKVTWNGGSIDATHFCFVINYNDSDLTINSGEFSVSDSNHADAAIVYVGNYDVAVTVNGGTFTTTDGNAVGIHVKNQALITINGGDWTCTGDYIFELVGDTNTLLLDKPNVTLNEGYKIASIYNAGNGHVEDDKMEDNFD